MEGRVTKPQSGNRELVRDYLAEIHYGFSVADIEYLDTNVDLRNRLEIKREISRQREIDVLTNKLAIAEAVAMANALQNKKNRSVFLKWRSKQVSRIRKLLGTKLEDGWNVIAGKSRKF